jgi:hypothetical protein
LAFLQKIENFLRKSAFLQKSAFFELQLASAVGQP